MVTALSTLTRLEILHLNISSDPDSENQPLPQPTRAVLPSLTSLRFKGPNEYLEDFLVWIDAPLLDKLNSALTCINPDIVHSARHPTTSSVHQPHTKVSGT